MLGTMAMSLYFTLARTMNNCRGSALESSISGIASSEAPLVLGLCSSRTSWHL